MKYFGKYNRNLRQLDLFKIFSFVLLGVVVFLSVTIATTSGNSKTIITPPYITSEFESVGDTFSLSYYEQIGSHLTNALLTVSPETINKSFDSIQGYFATSPQDVKAIKDYLIKESETIKKDNIYQAFYYLQTIPNHKHNSFTVRGLLKKMTGNIFLEEKKVQVIYKYKISNKKITITSFEVKE